MFYTIKEVAKKTNLPASTLRYYEKEEILPVINRDKHGNRIYDDGDVAWLELVTCLRTIHVPLTDLKTISKLSQQGIATLQSRIEILEGHRNNIVNKQKELAYALEKIDEKINYYQTEGTT